MRYNFPLTSSHHIAMLSSNMSSSSQPKHISQSLRNDQASMCVPSTAGVDDMAVDLSETDSATVSAASTETVRGTHRTDIELSTMMAWPSVRAISRRVEHMNVEDAADMLWAALAVHACEQAFNDTYEEFNNPYLDSFATDVGFTANDSACVHPSAISASSLSRTEVDKQPHKHRHNGIQEEKRAKTAADGLVHRRESRERRLECLKRKARSVGRSMPPVKLEPDSANATSAQSTGPTVTGDAQNLARGHTSEL